MQTTTPLLARITLNPAVCFGKPTVRNLRYPVEWVLELLASGAAAPDILAEYPDLEADDLRACLLYAAAVVRVKAPQTGR